MSDGEMRRAAVLAQVKSAAWTLVEASERMGLSYRQTKQLGPLGLLPRQVRQASWESLLGIQVGSSLCNCCLATPWAISRSS